MTPSLYPHTGALLLLTALLVLAPRASCGSRAMQKGVAPAAGEQEGAKAETSPQDKTYTWEDLLNKEPGAIANEKKAFTKQTDPKLKQRIASILLGLGVKDSIYFDYLADAAKKALQDDTPWPILYDDDGEMNKRATNPVFADWIRKKGFDPNDPQFTAVREYNPDFLDWCKQNGKEPNEARNDAEYVIPGPWYYLAEAGDPRAYELLIQGLHSHNLAIVFYAALGFAKLQDPRAVPELIAVGHRTSGEARLGIAIALLYFPDPKAEAAADEIEPIKVLVDAWREEKKRKGLKALFQW